MPREPHVDFDWMQQHARDGVSLVNRSADYAGLAVQGPKSVKLFDLFFTGRYSRPARNEIKTMACNGIDLYVSTTGYTGEDGFEVFFPAERAANVWNTILEKGAELGIKPCGLGARDTLRLEMCYPLNGSDLSPDRTPLEAGLSDFCRSAKARFHRAGRAFIAAHQWREAAARAVQDEGENARRRAHITRFSRTTTQIAEITSGTLSPTLNAGIGMAYIPTEFARINEEIGVDIRGRRYRAIEKKPLHRK